MQSLVFSRVFANPYFPIDIKPCLVVFRTIVSELSFVCLQTSFSDGETAKSLTQIMVSGLFLRYRELRCLLRHLNGLILFIPFC